MHTGRQIKLKCIGPVSGIRRRSSQMTFELNIDEALEQQTADDRLIMMT